MTPPRQHAAFYLAVTVFFAVYFGVGLAHLRALVVAPFEGWW